MLSLFATRTPRLLTGGPIEDAARAIYDRLPMSKTLLAGNGDRRIWWARCDYAGNGYWFGVKFDVRAPIVRVGVGIGEFGVRR